MLKKASRILHGIFSISMMLCGIHLLYTSKNLVSVIVIVGAYILFPPILEGIFHVEKNNLLYYDSIRLMFIFAGAISMMIMALFVYGALGFDLNATDTKSHENYIAISQVLVYVFYLLLLYELRNVPKKIKYVSFGILYIFCTLLAYLSVGSLNAYVIEFLNKLMGTEWNEYSFYMLREACIEPIKEAVLTYIIFDTYDWASEKKNNHPVAAPCQLCGRAAEHD